MPNGMKLVLPLTFTDATLPVLPDIDPLETPALGSLGLWEPGHPTGAFVGVPANGAVLNNLLSAKALALMPGSTAATLAATATITADLAGAEGRVERSAKGGIHIIQSQTGAPGASTRGFRVIGNGAVRSFLIANPTHDIFLSQWARWTRVMLTAAANHTSAAMSATTGDWFRFYARTGTTDTEYPTDASRLGFRHTNTAPNAAGPSIQNMARRPALAPGGITLLQFFQTLNGTVGTEPSVVYYRFYMEDLTVSGRSYATVDALDLAEYTKQVLTAGGRYYNDTVPTDPASVP